MKLEINTRLTDSNKETILDNTEIINTGIKVSGSIYIYRIKNPKYNFIEIHHNQDRSWRELAIKALQIMMDIDMKKVNYED